MSYRSDKEFSTSHFWLKEVKEFRAMVTKGRIPKDLESEMRKLLPCLYVEKRTQDKNTFMVLVLDVPKRVVLGHRLLDLNREYGLRRT